MTYTSYIYPGKYEIIKCGETEYIYSPKSIQELAREYDFTAKSYSKSIVQDIIRLNLDSKKEILEFHKIYGLLINTQNDPDNPTFLGIPITKEVEKAFVFPKSSGCSMSLLLFRYFVELIRNILNLTTEIAINENYKKPTNSSEYQCSLHKSEHMKNNIRIVQSFLSLLYQPYAMYGTIQKEITYVLDGMTPLSRFAFHYHNFAKRCKVFFSNDFIHKFNHSLLNLSEENEKLFEPFKPTRNRQANYSDPDQPTMFEPKKTIEFGPLIFNEDDIKKIENEMPISNDIRQKLLNNEVALPLDIPEKFATDSRHFSKLLSTLIDLEKHFKATYNENYQLEVELSDTYNLDEIDSLIKKVSGFAKTLVADTINDYISTMNYKLNFTDKKKYDLQFVSQSLLQNIFLEMATILNNYYVKICAYPQCKKAFFTHKKRPASCCCHNHYTNYKGLKDRCSPKLLRY